MPFNLHIFRDHAYSQRGAVPNQAFAYSRGANITTINAANYQGIYVSEAIMSVNVNKNIFQRFLNSLVDILGYDHYIIVMECV